MEKRALGETGENLSVVGVGAIVFVNEGPSFASNTVSRAIDAGVTYFDMGPYGKGEAEVIGGPAIKPYRNRIFLAEKTRARTSHEAKIELRKSLKKMSTDYFDLFQFHAVSTRKEVETIVGPGGALEAFTEARQHGLIRFIGFSAHTEEAAILMMEHFDFDSILFPVNHVIWYQGNFGPKVLEVAQQKGIGVLALKTLAKQPWPCGERTKWTKAWYSPVDTYEEAKTALNWTLSKPVTSCVSPSHAELLWWMIDAEKESKLMTLEDENMVAKSTNGILPIFQHVD